MFLRKVSFSTNQHFTVMFLMTRKFSNSALVRTFSETGRSLSLQFADTIYLVMQIKFH